MALTELVVRPGVGIGPIEVGMSRADALRAATVEGLTVSDFRRARGDGPFDLLVGDQLFAYLGDDGLVTEAEVAVGGPHPVICLDLDLAAANLEILARMKAVSPVDETNPEYPWVCDFPELGLSMWFEAGSEGSVDAILVRAPSTSQQAGSKRS